MAIPNGLTVVGEWDFTGAPDTFQYLSWQKSYYGVTTDGLFQISYSGTDANGDRVFYGQLFDSDNRPISATRTRNIEGCNLTGKHCVALVMTTINSTPTLQIYLDSYMWTHSNAAIASATNANFSMVLSSATSTTANYNGLSVGYTTANSTRPFTTLICYDRALTPTELRALMDDIGGGQPAPAQ